MIIWKDVPSLVLHLLAHKLVLVYKFEDIQLRTCFQCNPLESKAWLSNSYLECWTNIIIILLPCASASHKALFKF